MEAPFNMPDLMPTLLALARLPIPDSVEGEDRLRPNARLRASLIMLPVPITEARRYGFAEYRGLRTERYTYVRSIKGPWLLYDNQADSYQMHNLINTPSVAGLRRVLDRQLDEELRVRKDDFLPAREYLIRGGAHAL